MKPCPFCGCKDIRTKRNHRGVRLYCSNCKVGFFEFHSNADYSYAEQEMALNVFKINWNRRNGDEW